MAFSVEYIYQLVDRFSSRLRAIDQRVQASREHLNRFGSSARQTGTAMTAAFAGPLALAANSSLNFDRAMNNLQATSLATKGEMEALREQAKLLGSTTKFSATEAANAMNFLKMAGLDLNQVSEALPGTLQLAAAGNLELAQAADIATNVLAGYGMEVNELGRVNDVLASAAANSNQNVTELAAALRDSGPVASEAGVSFETTVAMIGKLADAGVKANVAGTSLKMMFARLAAPTDDATEAFNALGINLDRFKNDAGDVSNIEGLLARLKETGITSAQLGTIFGQESASRVRLLINAAGEGAGTIESLGKTLETAGGSAQQMADIQQQGAVGAVNNLKSAFEGLMIAIGESGLIDAITQVATAITGVVNGLKENNPQLLKYGTLILIAGAVIGPLVAALGFMATGIAALLPLFSLMAIKLIIIISFIAAVAAAVYLIYLEWDSIVEWFTAKIDAVKAAFDEGFVQGLTEILQQFNPITIFTEIMNGLITYIDETFGTNIGAAMDAAFTSAADAIRAPLESVFAWFEETLAAVMDKVNMVRNLPGNIIGGVKSGVGGAIDYVFGSSSSEEAAQAAAARDSQMSVMAEGGIAVRAEPGTQVTQNTTALNTGSNVGGGPMSNSMVYSR